MSVPLPRKRPTSAEPKRASEVCPEVFSAGIDAEPVGRIVEGSCQTAAAFEVSDTGGGVALSPPATLNCRMARRLDEFVSSVVAPAASINLDTELARLRVAASYVCRPRNNQEDAEPSEHGQANAIDISRFTFADGRTVSVKTDWQDQGSAGDFLRAVHEAACGPFTTVIGPDGDRWHEDHFHFDLIERGPDGDTTYCR